ncbi:MAG: aminopeptidase C [Lishizhenia sp.]
MKKIFTTISVFALILTATAQEFAKNLENSSYQFEKIVHLDATPVQSQGYTGTCWSFSALSFFESEMIRMGKKDAPQLSEMYIARKAYEGKAEKYIRMDGKTNFSEGGAFHDIPWVFKNHGLMPAEAYTGKNYGMDTHNHSEMFAGLEGYLQGIKASIGKKGLTTAWMNGFNAILDAYLGEAPETFTYEGKSYTPRSYADQSGLDMNDYVSLTSFTNHAENEECYLAIQDNWAWGKSYNVSLNDLVEATKEALKKGYTVAWGADVSEKGFSFRNGLGIVPENEETIRVSGEDNKNFSDGGADKISNAFITPVKEKEITAEFRQVGYDNKTTTDDHGMHITGLYKEKNGTYYFLVKNSWGTGNYPEGYLYISENYFKWKTINVYLHKNALNKDIASKLKM